MSDEIEVGAVCGVDGCAIAPTTEAALKRPEGDPQPVHDLAIVSDVICPWCYVAKRNLEKALALAGGEIGLRITWRPFELNPAMPKEGLNRREYRSHKFGSWERSQALDAQVAAAGKLAGIAFHYDLIERTPNTFDAHRLIWLAGQNGVQSAVVEALFSAYFVEGRDVGDKGVLAEIAKRAGIPETVVTGFLEDTAGAEEVRVEATNAIRRGISGVPTFFFDGKELFSGALKPELMVETLGEAMV